VLDILSVSYFPDEQGILTYLRQIYQILDKKLTFVDGKLANIYFVEVIDNLYDSEYSNLLNMTVHNNYYDKLIAMIEQLLKSHIDYHKRRKNLTFTGFLYLITDVSKL